MADFYADSSVLVKRHVPEAGSDWFRALTTADNLIITARISLVEVYSALNRRLRESQLNPDDYARIAADFTALCTIEYELVELTPLIVQRARQLLEHYPLRAYDAVQLASALLANQALQEAGLPPLTFLAADTRLLAVAKNEGLLTINPNEYS